jgi:hypothetical protein
MILEDENHFFKNFFSNEMVWLNHDHGDRGVVDISTVDTYSEVEVCTPIFLIHKSFLKNLQNSDGHIP